MFRRLLARRGAMVVVNPTGGSKPYMTRNALTRTTAFFATLLIGAGGGIAAYAALHDDGGGGTTVVRTGASRPAAVQTTALSVNEIYRRARGSVVQVTAGTGSSVDPLGNQRQSSAQGSGFVYDADGHVVTNQHVVDGAETVHVTYADGTTRSAKVVAS